MKKGFTLIELLTVIAIIGILAIGIIAIINPVAQMKKARDARRKAELNQIRAALELYRADKGSYPATDWVNSKSSDPVWIPGLTSEYIKTIPVDPINSSNDIPSNGAYTYGYYSWDSWCTGSIAGQTYILTTQLENTKDNDRGNIIKYATCDWSGANLYTLTSP